MWEKLVRDGVAKAAVSMDESHRVFSLPNYGKKFSLNCPLILIIMFKSEQHELDTSIFSGRLMGSSSTCIACCHPSADKGIFDERQDNISQE